MDTVFHFGLYYPLVTHRLEGRILPTRWHFLCTLHRSQYYAVFKNLKTASSFSFIYQFTPLPADKNFFIYICVILHEFVSTSLRKTCSFFPWFLTGIQLILFLSQPRSKRYFILRQMTLELMLVYSFINFVIPLPMTYIRHFRDNC